MQRKIIITMQLTQQNKTIQTIQQNGQQVNKSHIYIDKQKALRRDCNGKVIE